MNIGVGVYVKNSAEAVELYKEVFGLTLGYHVKNEDGSYFHSELDRDGSPFISVVEAKEGAHADSVTQLGVELPSADAVRRAYDLLREGGRVDMEIGQLPWSDCAASVIDRFGVWWYLSASSHRPDGDFDPKTYGEK